MENNKVGCSAETRDCDGGAGWGPGMGGGGGPDAGIGGTADAATGGSTGRGGGGGADHVPGTGCHPNSSDFRDVANVRHAKIAQLAFKICVEDQGGKANINIEPPDEASGEWRVRSVTCTWEDIGVVDEISTPTTLVCWNSTF